MRHHARKYATDWIQIHRFAAGAITTDSLFLCFRARDMNG
jgi:hypothetical protein